MGMVGGSGRGGRGRGLVGRKRREEGEVGQRWEVSHGREKGGSYIVRFFWSIVIGFCHCMLSFFGFLV